MATSLAMYYAKTTDSTHPMFYSVIAEETKRARGTLQIWSKDEINIKSLVQEKL